MVGYHQTGRMKLRPNLTTGTRCKQCSQSVKNNDNGLITFYKKTKRETAKTIEDSRRCAEWPNYTESYG